MKLSIIIPVYGVEQFVEQCLLSVFEQNIPESDFEIIIINDGTKDNSWNIVKRVCSTKINVVLKEQQNQGLSVTRNNGLKTAKGDFIWFVDSDDWIEPNCLKDIFNFLDNKTDILSFSRMFPEGLWNSKPYEIPDSVNSKEDFFKCNFPCPVQFYIYRRQFLLSNQLIFVAGLKHEDTLFTPQAILKANKIHFYRYAVYHFRKREGSITTTIDKSRVKSYEYILKKKYELWCNIEDEKVKNAFANIIANGIISHLDLAIQCDNDIVKEVEQFYIHNKEFAPLLKFSNKPKTKLLYYLICLSPFSIVKTYVMITNLICQLHLR